MGGGGGGGGSNLGIDRFNEGGGHNAFHNYLGGLAPVPTPMFIYCRAKNAP